MKDVSLAFSGDILLFAMLALLAGIVVILLLRPLRAAAGARADAGESEVALYRDQLAEIGRDLERGVIAEAEAAAARVEVSRRLLAADAARQGLQDGAAGTSPRRRRIMATATALGVPLLALVIYLQAGSPGLPDQPLAPRLAVPAGQLPVEALVVRIERRLKAASRRPICALAATMTQPAHGRGRSSSMGQRPSAWRRAEKRASLRPKGV